MNEVKVKGIYVLLVGKKVIAIRLELEDGQQLIIPIQKKEETKALEKAREKFYTAIEKVNRGEYDDNAPVPGTTGELVGSSEKERDERGD